MQVCFNNSTNNIHRQSCELDVTHYGQVITTSTFDAIPRDHKTRNFVAADRVAKSTSHFPETMPPLLINKPRARECHRA